MSDTINNKINQNKRFSREEDISHYTSIFYKLNETEVIKNGGITCIGGYCRCIDNKINCDCLTKLKQFVKNR
jgi:hypothetical protein